jgi:hypothetical protein
MSKTWSVERTLKEALLVWKKKTSAERKGHKENPIFDMIDFDYIFIDSLHLFLRVSDLLFRLLLRELYCMEGYNKAVLVRFAQAVHDTGVSSFEFWKKDTGKGGDLDQGSKHNLKWTSLMGDDKLKMFEKLDLKLIFGPGFEQRAIAVRALWDKFLSLNTTIKLHKVLSRDEISLFRKGTSEFMDLFLAKDNDVPKNQKGYVRGMYLPNDVTPYLHALCNHVHTFLATAASLGIPFRFFSCESLEKKNHDQVRLYFTKTRKDGGKNYKSAVREIMEIENRSLYFEWKYGDADMASAAARRYCVR